MNSTAAIYNKFKLVCFFLLLFTINGFPQTNTYNCYLKNINQVDRKNLEFDIWLEWTGTNTQLFCGFQAGVDFNYDGMANGGIITGAFVPGSAGAVGVQQTSPTWILDQTSKQIRMYFLQASPSILAVPTPPPPGFRLGTFRMTCSTDFTEGSTPGFTWYFIGTGNHHTTTNLFFYLNGETIGTNLTLPSQHFVESNPIINPGCTDVNAGGPYISCGDVYLNGSIVNASTGIWSTSGTGTFDPNNTTLNATYHPSIADLSSGSIILTLTSDTGICTNNSNITFTIDDNNLCTIDACNTLDGSVTHTLTPTIFLGNDTTIDPGISYILNAGSGYTSYLWSPNGQTTDTIIINQGGTYSVTVTDQNGCTSSDDISIILLGVGNLNEQYPLLIYPNPSNGKFSIRCDSFIDKCKLQLINVYGQEIYNTEFVNLKSGSVQEFNTNVSKGAYIVKLVLGKRLIIKKIIIN